MRPIHNRMPVILDQAAFDRWLDPGKNSSDVAALLKPFDPAKMEAWPVGTNVNRPANDDPSLVEKA